MDSILQQSIREAQKKKAAEALAIRLTVDSVVDHLNLQQRPSVCDLYLPQLIDWYSIMCC